MSYQVGSCAHCLRTRISVQRVRLRHVGLRYLCFRCLTTFEAMGMDVEGLDVEEPRRSKVAVPRERRWSMRRLLIAWLQDAA